MALGVSPAQVTSGGRLMKSYSIVRVGDDYVVQAEEQSILKVASRRRAAQLVTDAAELLNAQLQPATDPEPLPAESTAPSEFLDGEVS